MTLHELKGLLGILAIALGTWGCDQRMGVQPKYQTYEASARFPNRQSALPHVAGSVPVTGTDAAQPRRTLALMRRGEERYGIYCSPCHGVLGSGDGRVVTEFGFPRPPSLHTDRLRATNDQHMWNVITHGYGVMYPYASQIAPRDRWAIVAFVRALQLSRHAALEAYPSLTSELAQRGLE